MVGGAPNGEEAPDSGAPNDEGAPVGGAANGEEAPVGGAPNDEGAPVGGAANGEEAPVGGSAANDEGAPVGGGANGGGRRTMGQRMTTGRHSRAIRRTARRTGYSKAVRRTARRTGYSKTVRNCATDGPLENGARTWQWHRAAAVLRARKRY